MRRRTLGLALSAILAPSMSYAVGLGEISTYSALNQPLNAQIEMVSTTPDEVGGVTVRLAPDAVFEQVGITRSPVLNHLRFKPSVVNGVPVIKVSSDRPIQEPFVNFIVEVSWPKGKLLREYTVLLDPPVLGGGAPAATTSAEDIAEVPIFVSDAEPAETVADVPDITTPVEPIVTTETGIGEGLPPFVGEAPADLETFTVEEEGGGEIPEAELLPVAEEIEVVSEEPEFVPLEEAAPVAVAVGLDETDTWLPPFVGGAFDSAQAEIETFPADDGAVVETFADEASAGSEVLAADSYEVSRGDTLFSIAKRAKQGTPANIHQMMVAIQRANPSAFIRNDMNRIKAGYILRIPDAEDAVSISRAEAKSVVMAAISAQGGAFQEFKSQAAKTAVPQTAAPASAAPEAGSVAGIADLESRVKETGPEVVAGGAATEKPNLEILTPEGKGDSAGGGEAGDSAGAGSSAALVKEQIESTAKESEELQSRVSELESMIADKDRLIELKDDKLADLQTDVSEPAPTPETFQAEEEKAAEEASTETGGLLQDAAGTEAAEQVADAGGLTESEKMAEPAGSDETMPTDEAATAAELQATEAPTEPVSADESVQTDMGGDEEQAENPAARIEVDESTGLIDKIKENPGALAGVGAGVLLMSALAWLIFRRKEEEPVVIDDAEEALIDDAEAVAEEDIGAETLAEDELASTAQISADEVFAEPQAAAEPEAPVEEEEPGTLIGAADETGEISEDEVLAEANVYLAYGLHDQAVDLLKPAVEAHPERNDYIAKLAEAYHATGDKEAFIATAQKLQGPADGADKKLFQRVAVMGKDIAPEHEMFVNADTGDLTLTAITNRPDALTETGIGSDMPETMTIDSEDIDLSPDDTQLPDLDELSKSLQMEESEALKELRESAMEELEDESPDATNIHPAPDLGELKDEALDEVKEGLSDLTSKADESVAELDTRTLTLAMGNIDEEDLSLDELEDDFNSLTTGADEISTKLDLAKAYIDMGDDEGAREALEEVIANGNEEQQGTARKLLEQLK